MSFINNLDIGSIIKILIIAGVVIFVVITVKKIINQVNRSINQAKSIFTDIQRATEETANTPKTLSGSESLYERRIVQDFPEFNFDIGRQTVSSVLTSYFNVLNTDISDEKMKSNCTTSFINELEARKQMEDIKYNNFKIHKVVISDYRKNLDEAVITYQAALQYQLPQKMMTQFVYTVNYVYYLAYGANGENASLVCKHCGATIDSVGRKVCPYCDAEINSSVERTWKVNKIAKLR